MNRSAGVVPAETRRLVSLDVFRGVIILSMMFVNDIAEVPGTPWWLRHAGRSDDYMTCVDLVFPAFLFMVGMALPYALRRRLDAGAGLLPVWRHALTRTLGLVIIGFVMVNAEAVGTEHPDQVAFWQLAAFFMMIVIWHAYGTWKGTHPQRVLLLRGLGVLGLAALACVYPGRDGFGITAMAPSYWGIIGLIGWAYLGACVFYIPGRNRLEALLGGMGLWLLVVMANAANAFATWPFWQSAWNPLPAMAPHAAIVMAGAVLGAMLQPTSGVSTGKARIRWILVFASGLYAASCLFHAPTGWHPIFRISKLLASPAWCLRSAAYSTLLWLIIYFIVDVRGRRRGTSLLSEAGCNALLVYLVAPVFGIVVDLVCRIIGNGWGWETLAPTFALGVFRAACVAIGFTWLAAYLYRRGLFLKL